MCGVFLWFVRINTEEYVKTLKSTALVSINEEYSYVQPNVLFDNAFIYNKYSNITFRYGDDGYGFYNADGTLAVYCYGWRIEARDNKGNLVDFEDGKLTQMGTYRISVYPASQAAVVEFAPVTLTVTLEEPFLVQNEPSKFLTDDLGKNVTLLKDGKVISERIAYYGTEKGYRFVSEDGSAIMEYDIELNLTNVKYGIANEQGAQAIYVPQAGNYMTVFNVTHVESEIKQTVVASLIIKPLGEYGYDNTLLNLTQRFEGMFTNINFGGAEDASLIYNADEDSYGVIAEDGTFVPMTLKFGEGNDFVNGKINNFVLGGGKSFQTFAILSIEQDGLKYEIQQVVNFNNIMTINSIDAFGVAVSVSGKATIYNADGTTTAAIIRLDTADKKYKLYDAENAVIEGYDVIISGGELKDGLIAEDYVYYNAQLRYTSQDEQILLSAAVAKRSNMGSVGLTVKANTPLKISMLSFVFLEHRRNVEVKFVDGEFKVYLKGTEAEIPEAKIKIYYRETQNSEERIEITELTEDGALKSDAKTGYYSAELVCTDNDSGITVSKESSQKPYTAPQA